MIIKRFNATNEYSEMREYVKDIKLEDSAIVPIGGYIYIFINEKKQS
jgi:translation initiation factor 2 gamma subunit (eIF-2gamma)